MNRSDDGNDRADCAHCEERLQVRDEHGAGVRLHVVRLVEDGDLDLQLLCEECEGCGAQPLIICPGGADTGRSLLSRLPVWAGRRKERSASAEAQDMINKIKDLEFVSRDFSPPPASPRKHTAGSNPFAGSRRMNRCLTNSEAFEDEILPLAAPQESMSHCMKQLSSDHFEEKIQGLKAVQALAIHHSHILLGRQHDISVMLEQEVRNLRSVVAREAIRTIALLHRHLGMIMDPEASRTGPVLLRKLASNSCNFIHCEVNVALDELVKGCGRGAVLSALLPVGLNHRCVAVRESTARHLHQLAELVGVRQVLSAEKWFAETFLAAVIEMCLDAPHEVRFYGLKLFQALSTQREFPSMFSKLPDKDRRAVGRIQRENGF